MLAWAAGLLAACDSGAATVTVSQAVARCAAGASHVEVLDRATVSRVLGMRRSASGLHEGFVARFGTTSARVEDNAGLTGPIPLHDGEAVTIKGQFECNDGVIHWTHRDPRMHHVPGYIEAAGTRYQ